MDKKRIGLCIAYTGTNYGQLLQAFATQEVIQRLGYETEIIEYHSGKNKGIKPSFGALVVAAKQIRSTFEGMIPKSTVYDKSALHTENAALRKSVAEAFRKARLTNIVECNGISELRSKSAEYFAVVAGSDQIWPPEIAVTNFFTLRFAVPGVRRISYATSLGVSSYPNYAKKPARDFWEQIDYLSVREQQGKDIIQAIANVEVEVVADPTYLFTKNEWEVLIADKPVIDEGYILCYFLGDNSQIKNYARKFADEKGLRLTSILSDECCSDDNEYADEVLIGKSVEEFVNLIRHANYVLTDSFHGLAFSIINHRQVLVFYRNKNNDKNSRNSRIDNIVRLFNIEDRLVREPEKMNMQVGSIDYHEVSKKVAELRTSSLDFLSRALGNRGR